MKLAARWIATLFGVGKLPVAPGTWASLAALPFAWAITSAWGATGLAAATVVATAIGWWSAHMYISEIGDSDPREVVVDELVGQWIALLSAPRELALYAAAFVMFRLFDISKPWPIRWADRNVPGGLGVMLDDVLAGSFAAAVLALGLWALNWQ